MTQATVCAPYHSIDITPERMARHLEWVGAYVATVRAAWERQGHDVDTPAVWDALREVERDMLVVDRPQWMAPIDAIAIVNTADPDRRDYADALRTMSALTDQERVDVVARATGLTERRVAEGYVRGARAEGGVALYRHFDEDGVLLYVGIANDPAVRAEGHRVQSRWWPLSKRTDVEWHDSRQAALDAEVAAIRSELPLFNTQSLPRAARHRAEEYLLRRLLG